MIRAILLFTLVEIASFTLLANYSYGCDRWSDGDRIGRLLQLVDRHHPVLIAERAELEAQSRQRNWKAEVAVSYALKPTETDTEDGNASLRVSIPLFDRKQELTNAKAKSAHIKLRQQHREAFLKDLQSLCTTATETQELDTQREFWRDRLKYQQQRVEEGLDESVTLWQYVEKSRNAEYHYQKTDGALTAQLITLSRQYGGTEWKQLQASLAAMLN